MARAEESSAGGWPWLLAGGGAAAAALWWPRQDALDRRRDPSTGLGLGGSTGLDLDLVTPRWVFPVPTWRGRRAEISDRYSAQVVTGEHKHRKHLGADLMFRRASRAELVAEYPPGSPDGSPGYFMPAGHVAIAARDALVWSAQPTARGFAVVLSHGAPWATFYQHLERLDLVPTQRGASGQRVRAGQVLGVIGGNPSQAPHLRHLHFEIWRGGNGTHAIDPGPYLRRWPHLSEPARSTRAEG